MRLDKSKIEVEIILRWVKRLISSIILLIFLITAIIPVILNTESRQVRLNFDQELAKNSQQDQLTGLVWRESRGIGPKLAKLSPKPTPNLIVKVVITAYTSTPDQTDDSPFIAASGKHVYDGMVAANWLPFGTKIRIPSIYGEKIFTVDDRMNSRYGRGRIDVWLDAPRSEAVKFGIKVVDIEVYYQTFQLSYNL